MHPERWPTPRSLRPTTTRVGTASPCRAICGRWLDRIRAPKHGLPSDRNRDEVFPDFGRPGGGGVPESPEPPRQKVAFGRVEQKTPLPSAPLRDRTKRYPRRKISEIRQTAPDFRSRLGLPTKPRASDHVSGRQPTCDGKAEPAFFCDIEIPAFATAQPFHGGYSADRR